MSGPLSALLVDRSFLLLPAAVASFEPATLWFLTVQLHTDHSGTESLGGYTHTHTLIHSPNHSTPHTLTLPVAAADINHNGGGGREVRRGAGVSG